MIGEEHMKVLEEIAFSELAKPVNRVEALSTLSSTNYDIDKITTTLAEIGLDAKVSDAVKVKAIKLLDKLNNTSVERELSAVDAERIKQTLKEQYTGGKHKTVEGSGTTP